MRNAYRISTIVAYWLAVAAIAHAQAVVVQVKQKG